MNVRKVIKVPENVFLFLGLDYYVAWFEEMWEERGR